MSNVPLTIPDLEIFPTHSIADTELICSLRKTPSVLYGIFVEIVRQYYMGDARMLKGVPDLKWSPDTQKTDIWIDTELRWEDEHPEFRPAIYVKLGPIEYQQKPSILAAPRMNLKDGEYYYDRFASGSVSFVHISTTAGESCALCDDTTQFLSDFSQQIADDFCFTDFFEAQKQPLSKSNTEAKEKYVSSSSFSFSFGEQWGVKLESPILKSVDLISLQRYPHSGIVRTTKESPSLVSND